MKKISTLFATILVMMLSLGFTSCIDEDIAATLQGTWRGQIFSRSDFPNGYSYDVSYSEICFLGDPFKLTSGRGYWIDYYRGGECYANHMDWKVEHREIKVHLIEDDIWMKISEYRLSDNHFRGKVWYDNVYLDFDLVHTDTPDWDEFSYGTVYYWGSKKGHIDTDTRAASDTLKHEAPVRILKNNN